MRDQHNHHRIGARKVMRPAGWTIALPACLCHLTARATYGAKPVRCVPVQKGARARGQFRVPRADTGHDSPQFGKALAFGQSGIAARQSS